MGGYKTKWVGLIGLLLAGTLLAGCGFKGPLQLPDEEQAREQAG